ncbi:hypothetical protein C9374_004039 [Naegleria lovaniensis]|uniref:Uncharacterized protein n=1 Tax=Naegleria lovaniensis TaxID=51637 RepID=A0AA88H478_NAELO|nr:uncharacterized protein C9374_004039 [Naegleria lovaniensis]KAG2394275.1 hypothetical protein C9374_004039 [Naegleria lovaniensis]
MKVITPLLVLLWIVTLSWYVNISEAALSILRLDSSSSQIRTPSASVHGMKSLKGNRIPKPIISTIEKLQGWNQVNVNSQQSRLAWFSNENRQSSDFSISLSNVATQIEESSFLLDTARSRLLFLHTTIPSSQEDEQNESLSNTILGIFNLQTLRYVSNFENDVLPSELQMLDHDVVMPLPVLDQFGNFYIIRKNILNGRNYLLKLDTSSNFPEKHSKWTILYESDGLMEVMHSLLLIQDDENQDSKILLSTSRKILCLLSTSENKILYEITNESNKGYFGQLIRDGKSPYVYATVYGGLVQFEVATGQVISETSFDSSLVPYHVSSMEDFLITLSQFRTLDGSMIFATAFLKRNLSQSTQSITLTSDRPGECSNAISMSNNHVVILCRTKHEQDISKNQYTLLGMQVNSETLQIEKKWTLDVSKQASISVCSLQIAQIHENDQSVDGIGVACDSSWLTIDPFSGTVLNMKNGKFVDSEQTQIISTLNGMIYALQPHVQRIDGVSLK